MVLFSVMGTSSAVLTETVWALAHATPPVIPNRVVVLTTVVGRTTIIEELFSTPRWQLLIDALAAKGHNLAGRLQFGAASDHIAIFPAVDGSHDLDDILTTTDAQACADTILRRLRTYTESPMSIVLASLAGGRKTMGALLMSCMTLLGRPCDRVMHVLVNSPYDNPALTPPFFFPQPDLCHRLSDTSESIRSEDARIVLVDIPFVSMRSVAQPWHDTPATYRDMVACTQHALTQDRCPNVRLDATHGILCIGETSVLCLTPLEFAILLAILQQIVTGTPPRAWDDLAPRLLALHTTTGLPPEAVWWHDFQANPLPDIKEDVRKSVSRIRDKLRAAGIDAWIVNRLLPKLRARTAPYPADCITIAPSCDVTRRHAITRKTHSMRQRS